MNFDFTGLCIIAESGDALRAAELFADEIESRTAVRPEINCAVGNTCVTFELCDTLPDKDSYKIEQDGVKITVSAKGLRGLIFGYSYFLRKSEYDGKKITLIKDISGSYSPDKKIRGHQLGYRTCPNTYDAWDLDDYRRYYLDIMYFGCNTCEHIPNEGVEEKRNSLMKYHAEDLLVEAAALADSFDLDVSIWYPNYDEESVEQAAATRKKLFERVPRINAVFPPGGDPGDFPGDEFVERTLAISKALKSVHPNAQMWPSAQQPHSQINWGNDFIEEMEKLPDGIDGVITGPNHAFPIDVLRRKLPSKYPLRFYPDITHNVRCEYPVHFNRDDWHYALASGLSRECINPRPTEFRLLHRLTRQYVIGSVSYSEGVNDDINKMVWSDMDFFPDVSLYDTLLDYSRVFFPGVPARKVADGILGLESNWACDPAENPHIESTLKIWQELLCSYPKLCDNWRFVQCIFRAQCDALLRRRRIFEQELINDAVYCIGKGDISGAKAILETDFSDEYKQLHSEIFSNADRLFHQIGIQLDVEHYCANSWERGATLETIDLPVTDRKWLLNRIDFSETLPDSERAEFFVGLLNRNKVRGDEFYFSLAEHGFDILGEPQQGEFYLDFKGDRPNVNNGSIPMCMLKVYDHFSFRCKIGGLTGDCDYKIRFSFVSKKIPVVKKHRLTVNGTVIYEGKQFGGESDADFDRKYLAPGFESVTYTIPASVIENGCIELLLDEPIAGVMISEFWITRSTL